jgi:hypothetical protein
MRQKNESLTRKIGNAVALIVFLPIALLFLPIVAIWFVIFSVHRLVLYTLIWRRWICKGKDILFVYSDSPIWREYMMEQVLPAVENRAIVLNWSERKQWPRWSLAKSAFSVFAGGKSYNPMVLVFRPFRRPRVFRFFGPFKAWKQGNPGQVERVRQDLFNAL